MHERAGSPRLGQTDKRSGCFLRSSCHRASLQVIFVALTVALTIELRYTHIRITMMRSSASSVMPTSARPRSRMAGDEACEIGHAIGGNPSHPEPCGFPDDPRRVDECGWAPCTMAGAASRPAPVNPASNRLCRPVPTSLTALFFPNAMAVFRFIIAYQQGQHRRADNGNQRFKATQVSQSARACS